MQYSLIYETILPWQSERNNTTGKQNDWISGLSEYNNYLFPAVFE